MNQSKNSRDVSIRKESFFRNWITADGSSGFKAQPNRYHIYVSLACPWAHRTLMVRTLKGLEDVISITVVDWFLDTKGWAFTDKKSKCTLDEVNGCSFLKEVYLKSDPTYQGSITVPCLWDKQRSVIVNNESSEIIRMLNSEFQAFCKTGKHYDLDLYPTSLMENIDELNSWIYKQINNGVYICGFAKSQEDYDKAVIDLFDGLDKVEKILTSSRYLTGSNLTEADIRLFTTLIRFDIVYFTHFKANKKRIVEYANIWGFVRDIYQIPGIAETVDKEHIMKHYYTSHKNINPSGIVPIGPELDLLSSHGRDSLL